MKRNSWTRRITRGLGVVAILYVAACAYMWAMQKQIVFLPSPIFQTTPDRLGMKFENLHFAVGEGAEKAEIHGWWIPSDRMNAVTLLYLHGNYRNIANNLEHTLRLHNLGYNVLLVDYRGFGKSTGKPSEENAYQDAEAAWQYLLKVRNIKPTQAFIYGHSLGGSIAVDLAIHHPEAAGVVTESTFTSMQAMGEVEYGFLPVGLLLNQRFNTIEKIKKLNVPLLMIHGTWDKKVPVGMAKQLYAAAPQPKSLLLIEGGEHNNSGTIAWLEYRDALSAFVTKYSGTSQ